MKNVKGKVTWFNDAKGYGFIESDTVKSATGNSTLIFVHHTTILGDGFKTLAEDQEVTFDLVDGPKGPNAVNVSKNVS